MTVARPPTWEGRLLVLGAGLIGTSLGLAARAAGADVVLRDPDRARLELAVSLGAGRVSADATADIAVVAAPPAAVGALVVETLQKRIGRAVTHVSSVQLRPQLEVEASGVDIGPFLGGHPVAGKERSGPAYADVDLFRDRPWVLCPTVETEGDALAAVHDLVLACGAQPVVLPASTHDELFARLSHVPQLVASALAATLQQLDRDDVALSGTGIRDTTRLADSDPQLWAEIAAANAGPVAAALRTIVAELGTVADALSEGDDAAARQAVWRLVTAGQAGRELLPGKHGGRAATLATLHVVIPDEPGALAALLAAVAREQVNLEDLRVEHAPGQAVGLAELVVRPQASDPLATALRLGVPQERGEVEVRRDPLATALQAAGWHVSAAGPTAL